MFENVSRATELANEIREMWGHWQRLEVLRDKHRRNHDHRNGMITQRSMNELQGLISERLVQWQAETGKPWRVDYYNLPPSDDVMEKAFSALADELEAQDEELAQEVLDLLTVWGWAKKHDGDISAFNGSAISSSLWSDKIGSFALFDSVTEAAAWVRQQEGEP